jgi:hypothetical protein
MHGGWKCYRSADMDVCKQIPMHSCMGYLPLNQAAGATNLRHPRVRGAAHKQMMSVRNVRLNANDDAECTRGVHMGKKTQEFKMNHSGHYITIMLQLTPTET